MVYQLRTDTSWTTRELNDRLICTRLSLDYYLFLEVFGLLPSSDTPARLKCSFYLSCSSLSFTSPRCKRTFRPSGGHAKLTTEEPIHRVILYSNFLNKKKTSDSSLKKSTLLEPRSARAWCTNFARTHHGPHVN
jgi:hypothetical protein